LVEEIALPEEASLCGMRLSPEVHDMVPALVAWRLRRKLLGVLEGRA
jgi:hypothetical protein